MALNPLLQIRSPFTEARSVRLLCCALYDIAGLRDIAFEKVNRLKGNLRIVQSLRLMPEVVIYVLEGNPDISGVDMF